mgnify:CR=1 FL=1
MKLMKKTLHFKASDMKFDVFGGPLPDRLADDQALMPQSSYGAQKAVGEMLVHDYARKGFIDGRSLR